MAEGTIDHNALAQAIDSTWGRSSMPKTAGSSVKFTMGGGRLTAVYVAVVNFGTEHERIQTRRRCSDESEAVLAAEVKRVKATYKELAGRSLSLKELSSRDELELVGASPHSPRRTAMYRRRSIMELA